MSKSLWSRSVWNSLFNRVSGSRRLPRARRRLHQAERKNAAISEVLEERTVLAAVGVTFAGSTLTLTSTSGNTNEIVQVKAGAAFTDVLVRGQVTTRILTANSGNISTIVFNAGGGTADSLSVSGVTTTTGLTLDVDDLEKLQVNASTNVAVDSDTATAAQLTLVTSTISGTLTVNHEGDVSQSGKLVVSGDTTINALDGATKKDITLRTLSNSFGTLELNGEDVTVSESGPTDLGTSSATGTLTVTSSGAITSAAGLDVDGAATFTSNGSTVTANGLFGSTVTVRKATNATVNDTDGGTLLGTSTTTGSLTVTSTGAVTQSGRLTVGGLATITAAAGSNILLTGSNNFGSVDFSGQNIQFTEKSATTLADIDATGTLTVTSSGAITDSGALDVDIDAIFTSLGYAITLDAATSTFGGSLTFTGANIAVTDNDGATDLGASTAKGNLTVTTSGTFPTTVTPAAEPTTGGVTQSGALTVSGRLTVTATGITVNTTAPSAVTSNRDIILTLGNRLGSVSLFGKDVSISEDDATDLFTTTATGTLTVTSAGAVTDSGLIDVTGTTSITAGTGGVGAKSITLDDDESEFTGALMLDGSNASVINSVATLLDATTLLTGSFYLNSAGNVTGDGGDVGGRLTIDANTANITLGGGTFGSLSVTADGDVDVTEDTATDLFTSTIGGSFTLVSAGAVTDSGDVAVAGDTDITATTTITLNSAGSEYTGLVSLDGTNISFYNDTATDLNVVDASGTLTITSNGAISAAGDIAAGDKATFDALGHNIDLDGALNFDVADGVSLYGDNVTVNIGEAITLATSTITGTLDLTAAGDVTDIGTITVADTTTITAEDGLGGFSDVTLDSALNSFGELVLTADDVIINENDTVELGASTVASLKATATLGIEDTDTLTIAGLAELTANGGDIELDEGASTFGSLKLIGNNISVTEDNIGAVAGTLLAGISTPGDFTLTAQGAVTQTAGTGIAVGGDATIVADSDLTGAGDAIIDLTEAGSTNNFGTLTFKGSDVDITEASPTELSPNVLVSSTAAGTLTIVSGGSITANGVVTASGVTDLQAGAGGTEVIDLNNAGNTFGELRLDGGVVTINDSTATVLGASTVGTLNLTSGGTVSQVTGAGGNLTVNDLLNIATSSSVDLRETGTTNNFGMISIGTTTTQATTVTITEASGTVIEFLNISGNFDLIAGGNVGGDTVDITIGGTTTIVATGFDVIIDPTFGGAVNITADDITLIAQGALTLGNITATGDVDITATGNVANLTTPATGKLSIDGVLTINAGANDVNINIRDTQSNLSQTINPANITAGTLTTTIPTATITFNTIEGDDVINATESGSAITVSGTITGLGNGVIVGDKITLTLNDGVTTSNHELTIALGGVFTVDIPFAQLNGDTDQTIDAAITTPDYGAYAPTGSKSYTVDIVAPTVTINQAVGQNDPTNAQPINFAVVFSEAVTLFGNTDVTLSGTAGNLGGATIVVTGSGTTYNVAVSGLTTDGTVIATVNASAALDAAGNTSVASTSTDNTVTFDTTAPTVTTVTVGTDPIISADLVQEVTVNFSEAMDQGAFDPVITFIGTAGVWTSNGNGAWNLAGTQWTESFTVTDVNETVAGVQIDVTGTQDLAGNAQLNYAPEAEFNLNTAI